MNDVTKYSPAPAQSALATMPKSMGEAIKLAELMASAGMVPDHLKGDVGTCFLIVEQALRWNMSPFAVARGTFNIKGNLMYSGVLMASAALSCGAIVGEFDYEYTGDPKKPDTLSVVASAVRASDGQRKSVSLSYADAKTENPIWKKQPEQQLAYASSRVWCRRWSPGTILGVYAREEFNAAEPEFEGTTLDAKPEPAPTTRRDEINREVPIVETQADKQARWFDKLQNELNAAIPLGVAAVAAIADRREVVAALSKATGANRQVLDDMLSWAIQEAKGAETELGAANEPEGVE